MTKLKENLIPLSFVLTVPLINSIYSLLNNANRGVHSLITDMDRGIPFMSIFILPYMAWYYFLMGTLIYLCFVDKPTYYRSIITINVCTLICYVVFYIYQTTVPRPELYGTDVFTRLVQFVYNFDKPYNCFPSIHCLTSYTLALAINKSTAKNIHNLLIINIMSALIMYSTLAIKQHVVLDVLAAILISDLVYRLTFKIDIERVRIWGKKQLLFPVMKKKFEI
jgi:membrane-associated phospholipid phosphatase